MCQTLCSQVPCSAQLQLLRRLQIASSVASKRLSVAHAGSRVPGGLGLQQPGLVRFPRQPGAAPLAPSCDLRLQRRSANLLYAWTRPLLPTTRPSTGAYGEAACRLERFLFTCNLLGSVIFITCISLNRLHKYRLPFLHPQPTAAQARSGLSGRRWLGAGGPARCPTLSFFHLEQVLAPRPVVSVTQPRACTQVPGTADSQLEAGLVYSLALAALGCGLLLLLTPGQPGGAWGGLCSTATYDSKPLQVMVLWPAAWPYASSYVPYYITAVLNVHAPGCAWQALCPGFASGGCHEKALDQRTHHPPGDTGLVPLAICIHLAYSTCGCGAQPDCCRQRCVAVDRPQRTPCSSQALPLNVTATPKPQSSSPPSREPGGPPIFSPLLITRCWNPAAEWRQRQAPGATSSPQKGCQRQELPPQHWGPGQGHRANPRWGVGWRKCWSRL